MFYQDTQILAPSSFPGKQHGVHEVDHCDVLGVGGQGLEDEVQTCRVVHLLGSQVKTDCLQWSKQTRKENILPHEWVLGASLTYSIMEATLDLSKPNVSPYVFLVYSKFSMWNTITGIQYFMKSL